MHSHRPHETNVDHGGLKCMLLQAVGSVGMPCLAATLYTTFLGAFTILTHSILRFSPSFSWLQYPYK